MRQIDVAWNYPNNCILSCGYKMATKFLKIQRKSTLPEKTNIENPENTSSNTTDYPALICEGGRTVGSGRVATIIE